MTKKERITELELWAGSLDARVEALEKMAAPPIPEPKSASKSALSEMIGKKYKTNTGKIATIEEDGGEFYRGFVTDSRGIKLPCIWTKINLNATGSIKEDLVEQIRPDPYGG